MPKQEPLAEFKPLYGIAMDALNAALALRIAIGEAQQEPHSPLVYAADSAIIFLHDLAGGFSLAGGRGLGKAMNLAFEKCIVHPRIIGSRDDLVGFSLAIADAENYSMGIEEYLLNTRSNSNASGGKTNHA